MDLEKTIEELRREKEQLDRAIRAFTGAARCRDDGGVPKEAARPNINERGRASRGLQPNEAVLGSAAG